MTTAYAVEIEGLTKTYRSGFTAVSNLSMNVPAGVFGLLGPNGAGKTTTIQILVGAIRPSAGTARILGRDILKDWRRQNLLATSRSVLVSMTRCLADGSCAIWAS